MDSWLLSEELDFTIDGHGRCKTQMMGCEIKPFFNLESYPLVSNTQALERLDFMDLGFSDEIRKSSYSLSSEPSGEVFSDEIGADSYGNVVSPFCEERDSGSRVSADFMISNNTQGCSPFDLKLGRLEDGERAKESEFSKANVNVYAPSTTMLSPPTKRARLMSLHPQPPLCQVLGCGKDLSSCKGYYKRHKVCDMHTKTVKVIADGIEQRFCQQCSRFHVLNEFDDGKRSCRRRLAAHNKRRRKPQLTSESGTGIIGFSSPFSFSGVEPGVIINSGESVYNVSTPKTPNLPGILQKNLALSLLSSQSNLSGISWRPQPQPDNIKNMNTHHPLGQGIVLDLLQLSSHLQRIEHQRHSTKSEAG